MKYAQGLIDMLSKYPHIKRVFVNADGEWMFQPTDGYKEVSSDAVLKGSETKEADTETTSDNKAKKRK